MFYFYMSMVFEYAVQPHDIAFLQWSKYMVGDWLLGLLICNGCQVQPSSEAPHTSTDADRAKASLCVLVTSGLGVWKNHEVGYNEGYNG